MDLDMRFCKASDGVDIAYAAMGGAGDVVLKGFDDHVRLYEVRGG